MSGFQARCITEVIPGEKFVPLTELSTDSGFILFRRPLQSGGKSIKVQPNNTSDGNRL
jgi:hypothetical protein